MILKTAGRITADAHVSIFSVHVVSRLLTFLVEGVSCSCGGFAEVSAEALWSGLLQQNRKRFGKSTVETTKVRASPPAPCSRCAHA